MQPTQVVPPVRGTVSESSPGSHMSREQFTREQFTREKEVTSIEVYTRSRVRAVARFVQLAAKTQDLSPSMQARRCPEFIVRGKDRRSFVFVFPASPGMRRTWAPPVKLCRLVFAD